LSINVMRLCKGNSQVQSRDFALSTKYAFPISKRSELKRGDSHRTLRQRFAPGKQFSQQLAGLVPASFHLSSVTAYSASTNQCFCCRTSESSVVVIGHPAWPLVGRLAPDSVANNCRGPDSCATCCCEDYLAIGLIIVALPTDSDLANCHRHLAGSWDSCPGCCYSAIDWGRLDSYRHGLGSCCCPGNFRCSAIDWRRLANCLNYPAGSC
jgi:hypothetical protein